MRVYDDYQKLIATHYYCLLASMTKEQRDGAVLALTTMGVVTEDGYLTTNSETLQSDFYVHCYKTLSGVILGLKMLSNDGLIQEDAPSVIQRFKPGSYEEKAKGTLRLIEEQMKTVSKLSELLQ